MTSAISQLVYMPNFRAIGQSVREKNGNRQKHRQTERQKHRNKNLNFIYIDKHHLFYFYKHHLSLSFEKSDAYKRKNM